jgi:hypothetical protein
MDGYPHGPRGYSCKVTMDGCPHGPRGESCPHCRTKKAAPQARLEKCCFQAESALWRVHTWRVRTRALERWWARNSRFFGQQQAIEPPILHFRLGDNTRPPTCIQESQGIVPTETKKDGAHQRGSVNIPHHGVKYKCHWMGVTRAKMVADLGRDEWIGAADEIHHLAHKGNTDVRSGSLP